MAKPTYVSATVFPWGYAGTFDTASISVQPGDLIVAIFHGSADGTYTLSTSSGSTSSWTMLNTGFEKETIAGWATVSSGSSVVIEATVGVGSEWASGAVYVFRNTGGVGASVYAASVANQISTSITTTGADSAIVIGLDDHYTASDGSNRTWDTSTATPTETYYYRNAAHCTVYGAYYDDAGAAAAHTVGLTAPSLSDGASIIVVEVLAGASATAPTVTDSAVTSIAATTATANGNVTSDGGATVTERGVCYSKTNNPPTTTDSKATTSGTTGAYTVGMTGLSPSMLYYTRCYAINSVGTSYGTMQSFTTSTGAISGPFPVFRPDIT